MNYNDRPYGTQGENAAGQSQNTRILNRLLCCFYTFAMFTHRYRMEIEKKTLNHHDRTAVLKKILHDNAFSNTAREHGCTVHTTCVHAP